MHEYYPANCAGALMHWCTAFTPTALLSRQMCGCTGALISFLLHYFLVVVLVSERLEDLVESVKTQADSGYAVKSERQHIYRIRGEILFHVRAGGTAYQSHPPPGEQGENQSEKQDHKDHNEGYSYVHVHGVIINQVLV